VTYLEQVKRLLTREVYTGFISYPPWNVTSRQGHHRRLISPETYDRIRERLREGQKLPMRKDLQADFPLRGFVLCGDCGRPYTAAWSRGKKKRFPYYRCLTLGCPCRHKSVRADRMHAEFETVLKTLRPRESILSGVKAEFQAEWDRRMLDVEAVRKERQRKLDAIRAQIDGYLDAIPKCHNPTVLKKIEEEVEALEARRLRLGGRIEKSKTYDFGRALDLAFDFLKDPSRMWVTGDLEAKRLVLRLVFTEPLVFDRKTGFGTPTFSPPINVSCVLELDRMELVDQIRKSWNTLEAALRDWAELLSGLAPAKERAQAA
jgi:hypothetical protein